MIRLPTIMEMIREVITVNDARNERYWNNPAPGISSFSKYAKR